ncbi:hypothetical protein SDC9_196239 [bioreactor metagenome]|uniref:Uncharacterized protein n=1 Tax=bioreactor metagenome TaxID=1076179 RepID=A0A645IDT9_9ZZZZ
MVIMGTLNIKIPMVQGIIIKNILLIDEIMYFLNSFILSSLILLASAGKTTVTIATAKVE